MKRPPILILHGWGRAKNAFIYYKKIIDLFEKKGYTVYAPDMPGFGEAANPKYPFTLQDYAEFLENYIQKHKIQSPILIGHSFGGRVIVKYVSSGNTHVKAIILSGTPGYSPVKRVKWVALLILSKIGGFIFSLPGLSKIANVIRGWFYYIVGARDFYRAQGSMRQTFKNIVSEKLEDHMKKINIPTLLVWGEDDTIVPVQIAKQMKYTIQNSKLVIIPHGKHSVIVDDPKTFVKEVCLFI